MIKIHKFKFDEEYFVLDIASGSLHVIDKLVYDLIDEDKLDSKQNLIKRYEGIYDEKVIEEAYDEITELIQNKFLYTEDVYESIAKNYEKKPMTVKALCLNVAHDCNLRCQYCFADGKGYNWDRELMPLEVAKKSIDLLIEKSGMRKNLEVDFFGGEPLLNMDVVKKTIDYAKEQEKKYDKKFRFTMTTNGMLLNEDCIEYLDEHMLNVVLSLDGRKKVHDAIRITANHKGSYDYILPKIQKVVQKRHASKKQYFIRGTFTRKNLDFYEDVKHFIDLGFKEISIEPVALPKEDPLAIQNEDLDIVYDQYEKICRCLIEHPDVNFYHFNIDIYKGPCMYKRIVACGAGDEYLAVTPKGEVYPCHQFIGQEEFCMGDVFKKDLNEGISDTFKKLHVYHKPECRGCWARFYCSGGCKANSYKFNQDFYKPYEMACKMQKKRIECAMVLQYHKKASLACE